MRVCFASYRNSYGMFGLHLLLLGLLPGLVFSVMFELLVGFSSGFLGELVVDELVVPFMGPSASMFKRAC